jgi:hypothetical protein
VFQRTNLMQDSVFLYPTRQIRLSTMNSEATSSTAVQDAPIFSLPTELLARIIFHTVELDPPGAPPIPTRHRAASVADLRPPSRARRNTILFGPPSRLGWIQVTHVCRQWRDAALAYSGLWATIPLALGGQWARAALERAKSAELVIHHTFYPGTAGSAFLTQTDFLPNEIHRVRKLELGGALDAVSSVLKRLSTSAPVLEILAIQADREIGPNDSPLTLPRQLFGGSVFALRDLSLDNCLPSTTPYDLSKLQHLSLCLRSPKRDLGSTQDPFALLRDMPMLETLTLKHCLSGHSDPHDDPFELPCLRRLEIVDTSGAIARFLRIVSFPRPTTLDIQCSMSSGIEDESSRALAILSPCTSHVTEPRSITFSSDGRGLRMELSSSPTSDAWIPGAYVFLVHSGSGEWDCPRIVREACSVVQPAHVEAIDLRFSVPTGSGDSEWRSLPLLWTNSLHRFQNVRSIHTTRALGWAVCSALSEGQDEETRLFPQLQTLTLIDVDFHTPMYLDNLLGSVVRARQGTIEKVRLIGCQFRDGLVPELSTMVKVEVSTDEPPAIDS